MNYIALEGKLCTMAQTILLQFVHNDSNSHNAIGENGTKWSFMKRKCNEWDGLLVLSNIHRVGYETETRAIIAMNA